MKIKKLINIKLRINIELEITPFHQFLLDFDLLWTDYTIVSFLYKQYESNLIDDENLKKFLQRSNQIFGGKKNNEFPWGKKEFRSNFFCANINCLQHHANEFTAKKSGFFSKSGNGQNGTKCGLCGSKRKSIISGKSNSTDHYHKSEGEKTNKCGNCNGSGHNKRSKLCSKHPEYKQ